MQNHRRVMFFFAPAITAVSSLAVVSPAQAEDPIVKLVSVANGKCLQPVNGSLNRGEAIVQKSCDGSHAQQWTITSVSSTKVHLVNRASQLCLDARGKARNGTPIQQWPCNRISNENWSFGITNNLLSSGVSNTWSHCISTPGVQDGLAMELRACKGSPEQLWNRPPG
jgi:Ricin-type beta-trefoil lectin domain-like